VIYARTMRLLPRAGVRRATLAAALAAGALSVVAGCGKEEGRPIPASAANDIIARLDEVERRVAANACNDVRQDSLPALEQEIANLPARVDANVRSTLENGLGRLTELVEAECVEPQTQPPAETVPDVAPAEPEPTPSPEPQPEPQPEPDDVPTPTPDGDGGNGNGGGGGGGSDGGGSDGGGDSGFVPDGGGSDPDQGADPGGGGGVVTPPPTDGDAT
jgi:hypothetical protein